MHFFSKGQRAQPTGIRDTLEVAYVGMLEVHQE